MSAAVDLPVGVEQVWSVLTSPGWPLALDAQLHDGSVLLSAEPTAEGGLLVRTSRRLPDGVPGYLQRFTPADGRVTQTDTWGPAIDGVRSGTWEVSFPGSPATMGGSTDVQPGPDGCRWTVRGTVKVSLPLVGGKVEGFLAPLLEKLVARQGQVLRTQLPAS